MHSEHLNPFRENENLHTHRYHKDLYIREGLAASLLALTQAGEPIVVADGRRRVGTTTLIRRAVGGSHHLRLIHADLWGIAGSAHMTQMLTAALADPETHSNIPADETLAWRERIRAWIREHSKQFPPSTHPMYASHAGSGLLATGNWPALLEAADAASSDKRLVLLLDGFHDVLRLPAKIAKGIIGRLRGFAQTQSNTTIIMAGGSQRLMRSLYADTNGPLWGQAKAWHMSTSLPESFDDWLIARFKASKNITLPSPLTHSIRHITNSCIADILGLSATLWDLATPDSTITQNAIHHAVDALITERAPSYRAMIAGTRAPETYMGVLTFAALHCTDQGVLPQMTSRIARQLTGIAPGSIKNCIDSLETTQLVLTRDDADCLCFDDPFLRLWLQRRHEGTMQKVELLS